VTRFAALRAGGWPRARTGVLGLPTRAKLSQGLAARGCDRGTAMLMRTKQGTTTTLQFPIIT